MSKLATDLMKVLSEVDSDYGDYENPHFMNDILDVILLYHPTIESKEDKLFDAVCDEIRGMFER